VILRAVAEKDVVLEDVGRGSRARSDYLAFATTAKPTVTMCLTRMAGACVAMDQGIHVGHRGRLNLAKVRPRFPKPPRCGSTSAARVGRLSFFCLVRVPRTAVCAASKHKAATLCCQILRPENIPGDLAGPGLGARRKLRTVPVAGGDPCCLAVDRRPSCQCHAPNQHGPGESDAAALPHGSRRSRNRQGGRQGRRAKPAKVGANT
jgi:hypothetical protein